MEKTFVEKRKHVLCISICILSILYITLFSRVPTLTRTVRLALFWRYTTLEQWLQSGLNAALFIPLGFFLKDAFSRSRRSSQWTLITALVVSSSIELIQFYTYRGILDSLDLISNFCGAGIGMLIQTSLSKSKLEKNIVDILMICASIIGCILFAGSINNSNIKTIITQQFEFQIESIVSDEEVLRIDGICYTYDRETPAYSLFIGDVQAKTDVNKCQFTAASVVPNEKEEIQIQFKGYPLLPTGTFLRLGEEGFVVDYVGDTVPIVDGVPETAVLKSYNADYDVMVFQNGLQLIWLIGDPEIDSNTEIIYHINTNEPDKLPKERIQYKFDNRGFRVKNDEKAENELEQIKHYRVFKKEIPEEYNVTGITVGFNTDGAIIWSDSFRVN